MRVFLTANNEMHNQLLNAFQDKVAVSIDMDNGERGDWYHFHVKLATMLELGDIRNQEAIHRFWVDVLPAGAYGSPSHEFCGSQAALDVEEILDGKLDEYTPAGWVLGTFSTGMACDGEPALHFGWFRPCAEICTKPKVRNIAWVETGSREVA